MGGRNPWEPSLKGVPKRLQAVGGALAPALANDSGSPWPGRSCRRLEKIQSSPTSWLQNQQETSWGPGTL